PPLYPLLIVERRAAAIDRRSLVGPDRLGVRIVVSRAQGSVVVEGAPQLGEEGVVGRPGFGGHPPLGLALGSRRRRWGRRLGRGGLLLHVVGRRDLARARIPWLPLPVVLWPPQVLPGNWFVCLEGLDTLVVGPHGHGVLDAVSETIVDPPLELGQQVPDVAP